MNVGIFGKLWRRIFPIFTRLEIAVLTATEKGLSPDFRQTFKAQLQQVNRVRRDPDGLETLLYCIKKGRPFREFSERFPLSPRELKLSDVEVRYFGRTVPVAVWAVDGVLFRLEFGEAIKKFDIVPDYEIELLQVHL